MKTEISLWFLAALPQLGATNIESGRWQFDEN